MNESKEEEEDKQEEEEEAYEENEEGQIAVQEAYTQGLYIGLFNNLMTCNLGFCYQNTGT